MIQLQEQLVPFHSDQRPVVRGISTVRCRDEAVLKKRSRTVRYGMRYEMTIPHSHVVAKTIVFLIISLHDTYRISLFALNIKNKEFSKTI